MSSELIQALLQKAFPIKQRHMKLLISGDADVQAQTVSFTAQLATFEEDGQLRDIKEQDVSLSIATLQDMRREIDEVTARLGTDPTAMPADLFPSLISPPAYFKEPPILFRDLRLPRPQTPTTQAQPDGLTRRTTVRLHPRPAHDIAIGDSKLGGSILWPEHERWPRCDEHGSAMIPVLQLAKSDVPELGFRDEYDLFQLLWCPHHHEDCFYAPRSVVRWRVASEIDALAPIPEPGMAHDGDFIPATCALFPERVDELPSAFELDPDHVESLDRDLRQEVAAELERLGIPEDHPLYQYHFSVAPGSKVGGHVAWIQDPQVPTCACEASMEHLLTIASLEADGACQRWMPESERDLTYPERNAVAVAPTDLMFGDAGNYYIFICRRCGEWPIATVMQCS